MGLTEYNGEVLLKDKSRKTKNSSKKSHSLKEKSTIEQIKLGI